MANLEKLGRVMEIHLRLDPNSMREIDSIKIAIRCEVHCG
jgi:hypothetical protein